MCNQRFPAWLPDGSMTIKQAARKNIVEFTRIRAAMPPAVQALLDGARATHLQEARLAKKRLPAEVAAEECPPSKQPAQQLFSPFAHQTGSMPCYSSFASPHGLSAHCGEQWQQSSPAGFGYYAWPGPISWPPSSSAPLLPSAAFPWPPFGFGGTPIAGRDDGFANGGGTWLGGLGCGG